MTQLPIDGRGCSMIPTVIAVFVGLAIYVLTCAPGVVWQDGAMFQHRIWGGDVRGELGLPLAHPSYILLAKAFSYLPLGSHAFRANLFSAVCGAAALGMAMHLLLSLTRSRSAAVVGTILLGVSHTFWMHSTMAEVYTLYALVLLIELSLLERFFTDRRARWLILAFLANGLNVSNHLLALLHWPAYLCVCVWAVRAGRIHIRYLSLCGVAAVLGTLPYTWLIVSDIVAGQPISETIRLALVGPPNRADKVLALSFHPMHQALRAAKYFLLNFPTPIALLGPLGFWWSRREERARWFAAVGGLTFAVAFVFAFRYPVPDQYVFFMPCYVLFALFAGLGAARIARESKRQAIALTVLALLPVAVYEAAPWAARRLDISLGVKREIPYRDTYVFFLRPRRNGDDGARRFAEAALAQAAPDGLLIADATIKNVLVYVRDMKGIHRGVTLTYGLDTTPLQPVVNVAPQAVEPFVSRGSAYICSNSSDYVPDWIEERFDLMPVGPVYSLRPKTGRGAD